MSSKDKWVRRFSVDETSKHKNGFTIYKITSVLFPIESPEAVTAVSVWKRYSDVQRLHKSMRSLHAGLHLRGAFPTLPRSSYFKRFQKEVIEERAKTTKALLEFVADHRLLFTSTDFVNFLQTGYPEPENQTEGVINAIRSSLHLPIEETQPIEYQTDDDETRTPSHSDLIEHNQTAERDVTDFISQIPIYEAADVEIRKSPEKPEFTGSFESIESLGSIDSDVYDELSKVTIDKRGPSVRKHVLPDLINFDAPSTSRFDDYHTMRNDCADSDAVSMNSQIYEVSSEYRRGRTESRSSVRSKCSVPSLSGACGACSATRTEDTYVFEAGYLLRQASGCEGAADYRAAFHYYKAGIEKMLIGIKDDPDPQRKALIKEKTNKYLSYAETLYKKHLCDVEPTPVQQQQQQGGWRGGALPLAMLRRGYGELGEYRVLGLLGSSLMLVMHRQEQLCYAMKVIQKIPNNLTEFDEYFLQTTQETRQPILPTVIPYMVPLHAYVETTNLIFLILSYAPGEKLFDYIKKYSKTTPNTPAREVNLDNVFPEPNRSNLDTETILSETESNTSNLEHRFTKTNRHNLNLEQKFTKTNRNNSNSEQTFSKTNINNLNTEVAFTTPDVNESHLETTKTDIANENLQNYVQMENNNDIVIERRNEVAELVFNSQKLLSDVDKALSGSSSVSECAVSIQDSRVETTKKEKRPRIQLPVEPRESLPASAICKWGAEILTAIESLHNCGIICRDLNPSNILLGEGGQVILTYMAHHPGLEAGLARLRAGSLPQRLCVAPELFHHPVPAFGAETHLCDFWSFGALMYELLCSVPLSYHHRAVFTSHTILHLPEGLSIEEQSLLSQLLTYEPSERLGAGGDGIEEIKRHPYFKSIDWQHIRDACVLPG